MNTIIQDVCDVVMKRISDGKIIFTAIAQLSSVSQKIKEEKIKGGIGNGDVAILRSEKEISLKVKNAIFDSSWLEMVAGVEFDAATKTVYKTVKGLVLTAGIVTLTEQPKNDAVTLIDGLGRQFVGTYENSGKTVTITGGVDGDVYLALYQIEVVGNVLPIKIDTFSENYYVEYSTIEYNPSTNVITKGIIWQFDKASPSSQFDISFESGKNYSPEIEFTILKNPNSSEVGRVIEVDLINGAMSATPITAIAAISGTPQVGVVLTAGALTPLAATVTYQWRIAETAGGVYSDIALATASTYTPVTGDATKFLKVAVVGTGAYSGTATSVASVTIAAA